MFHEIELLTSREGQSNLFLHDFNSNEIMTFVKPAVIQQQSVPLPCSKPTK